MYPKDRFTSDGSNYHSVGLYENMWNIIGLPAAPCSMQAFVIALLLLHQFSDNKKHAAT